MSDTSPQAAAIQDDIYRRMSGAERLRLAFEMSTMVRDLAAARLRNEHPDWSDWQIKRELLRFAFDPAPLPEGLP
ncbi:MAG TPA: hypothetical protein VFQ45_01195 [Longimicrobium sp.]|nr:hypothetical protein [Longimicrobium sp.]